MKNTILQHSGWYSSSFSSDSEGVQYVVMHYIGPAEEGIDAPEGAWFHKAGEDVGEAVVHY